MWLLALMAPAHAGFVDGTPPALALEGDKACGGAFLDYDGDGDWDLVAPGLGAARLIRNDGGAWTDVTDTVRYHAEREAR